MKVLLDTCTFLWVVTGHERISKAARAHFVDPGNEVFLSAASAWEIAVKWKLGHITLDREPGRYVAEERERHGIRALPIDEASALCVARLPDHHRDPFDRMLVCQAIMGGLTILTPDEDVRRYPVATAW